MEIGQTCFLLERKFGVHKSVFENGLRVNDIILWNTASQYKLSKTKLKRIRYEIKSGPELSIDEVKRVVTLPSLRNEYYTFELVLVNPEGDYSTKEENWRYLLKATSDQAFQINGVWAREAFLERGDIISIGFNKILTKKSILEGRGKDEFETAISDKIIKSDLPIFLEGETGTGKTYLAKKIHNESGVRGKFIHINISSYAKNLLESELFGHVKGAFTGAIGDKKGLFLQAIDGTLFIDEIDSLEKDIQTKLLLYLENFEFRPVGGQQVVAAKTRLIFASGRPLVDLVAQNDMRKDFYFRLKTGYVLSLKSLREERHKIGEFIDQFEKNEWVVVSKDLRAFYQGLDWPGNIRQLKAHLHKKKILTNGNKLQYDESDKELLLEKTPQQFNKKSIYHMKEMKRRYCINALLHFNGDYKLASRALKISPVTFKGLIKMS